MRAEAENPGHAAGRATSRGPVHIRPTRAGDEPRQRRPGSGPAPCGPCSRNEGWGQTPATPLSCGLPYRVEPERATRAGAEPGNAAPADLQGALAVHPCATRAGADPGNAFGGSAVDRHLVVRATRAGDEIPATPVVEQVLARDVADRATKAGPNPSNATHCQLDSRSAGAARNEGRKPGDARTHRVRGQTVSVSRNEPSLGPQATLRSGWRRAGPVRHPRNEGLGPNPRQCPPFPGFAVGSALNRATRAGANPGNTEYHVLRRVRVDRRATRAKRNPATPPAGIHQGSMIEVCATRAGTESRQRRRRDDRGRGAKPRATRAGAESRQRLTPRPRRPSG